MVELEAGKTTAQLGKALAARAEAEYDQRITQKWILQPAIEVAMSASDIPELEIGSV